MAEFRFSEDADRDLQDITTYTALQFGVPQARRYTDEILSAAQVAADLPSLGLTYTAPSGMVFKKYHSGRHTLFYQPTETGVLIVRILHSHMDFDRHLD